MSNGTLLTPYPMPDAERAMVEECFTRTLGRPIKLAQRVDRSLLGGICVTVDGMMYDGTIRARLEQIRHLLEDGDEEVVIDADA